MTWEDDDGVVHERHPVALYRGLRRAPVTCAFCLADINGPVSSRDPLWMDKP
jgi:hypothetical protein